LPVNTVIKIVPQQTQFVIERMGKYHRTLSAGLHVLLPIVERIAYVHTLKVVTLDVLSQSAVTLDNVHVHIDGVVFVRVYDAVKASYEVDQPMYSIVQLAQTTMRSEIGKMKLDEVFAERELLNSKIVEAIGAIAKNWGLDILRYEVRDIQVPQAIRVAMDLEAEAERKKRKMILESEASRTSEQNIAEGLKVAQVLRSEGMASEMINAAKGEAEAIRLRADATAVSIERVAQAVQKQGGRDALMMKLAEEYLAAWGQMAKKGTNVVVPENVNDVAGIVGRAWGIMGALQGAYDKQTVPAEPSRADRRSESNDS
jgi:regulator of protease activity HflC (stomatin/prohibitin superfamily)